MKHRILWLGFLSVGFAFEAGAVTYDYYLQVPAVPQAGLAAWTATWTSNTLNPPVCFVPVVTAGIVSPFFVGTPSAGVTASRTIFCFSPGLLLSTQWVNDSPGELIEYDFNFPTAPFTTGVFPADGSVQVLTTSSGGPISYNGPNATLTITEAVFPIPRWRGSIVRLSLTVAGPVTPPPGSPVEVLVGFVDMNGNPIGQYPPVLITPGQVSTVELDPGTSPVAFGHHTAVVPVVSAPPGQVLPPLQLTTEVLDSLTRFGAVLTTATGLAPPPASFSPQGLAAEQVMRLTATAFPPTPCAATLSFANAQGVPVGPSLTVNLSPGQSQSLDLTSAMLNVPFGKSVLVQPMAALQVPISSAVVVGSPACGVSSDVFDVITNRTWTYQVANVH